MTQEILFEIISKLENIEFNVIALVSDMGPSNIGLWKKLGITPLKPFFVNPITHARVHVFADVPHLLKLIRNHFL